MGVAATTQHLGRLVAFEEADAPAFMFMPVGVMTAAAIVEAVDEINAACHAVGKPAMFLRDAWQRKGTAADFLGGASESFDVRMASHAAEVWPVNGKAPRWSVEWRAPNAAPSLFDCQRIAVSTPGSSSVLVVEADTVREVEVAGLANATDAAAYTAMGDLLDATVPAGNRRKTRHSDIWIEVAADRGLVTIHHRHGWWESYDLATGATLDASDRGALPGDAAAYVRTTLETVRARLAPETPRAVTPASVTAQEEDTQVQEFTPSVAGAPARVKHEELFTMIDWSDPNKVKAAGAHSVRIRDAYKIDDLAARRADLEQRRRAALGVVNAAEAAYRMAEVAQAQAERDVKAAAAAVKERAEEMVAEAAGRVDDAGKRRHSSAAAAEAAAVAARKTDAAYLALKQAVGQAENIAAAAERAAAEARVASHAADRDLAGITTDAAQLAADTALAVARINAFQGLDAAPRTA